MTEEQTLVITRIERGETEDGKPVVEMYEENPRFRYPSLRLFDLSKLFVVGIDPNDLQKGDERFVRFRARYVHSDRINNQGNPYKDVTGLEPIACGPDSPTDEKLDQIIVLLGRIERYLSGGRQEADVIAPEPEPRPVPTRAEAPSTTPDRAEVATPKAEETDPPPLNEDQSRRRFGRLAGPAIRNGLIDIALPGQLTAQVAAKAINWRAALQQLEEAIHQ